VAPGAVRREGAVLPRATFDAVMAAMGTPAAEAVPAQKWTLRDGLRRILGRPLP